MHSWMARESPARVSAPVSRLAAGNNRSRRADAGASVLERQLHEEPGMPSRIPRRLASQCPLIARPVS